MREIRYTQATFAPKRADPSITLARCLLARERHGMTLCGRRAISVTLNATTRHSTKSGPHSTRKRASLLCPLRLESRRFFAALTYSLRLRRLPCSTASRRPLNRKCQVEGQESCYESRAGAFHRCRSCARVRSGGPVVHSLFLREQPTGTAPFAFDETLHGSSR